MPAVTAGRAACLICAARPFVGHLETHYRRAHALALRLLSRRIRSSVAVRAAYAFGDWPPARP